MGGFQLPSAHVGKKRNWHTRSGNSSSLLLRGDSILICHSMSVTKLIKNLNGIDAFIHHSYTEEEVSSIEVRALLNSKYQVYKVGLDTGNTYSTT